jgi:1,4-dihydroxy-6-naphthoate synthase
MRAHAQEHNDAVLMQHVDLYVSDWTVNLGPVGMRAVEELSARAASIGLGTGRRLEIFAGCGK